MIRNYVNKQNWQKSGEIINFWIKNEKIHNIFREQKQGGKDEACIGILNNVYNVSMSKPVNCISVVQCLECCKTGVWVWWAILF